MYNVQCKCTLYRYVECTCIMYIQCTDMHNAHKNMYNYVYTKPDGEYGSTIFYIYNTKDISYIHDNIIFILLHHQHKCTQM